MLNYIWKPQPKQQEALICPADELFFGGARGGGKSDFLLADFCKGLQYGSDHRGIMFRKTYPELEELITRGREIYFKIGAEYKKAERTFYFPGGSTLKMRHMERDEDVHKYQGHQYTWIGFDELTNWDSDYCYIWIQSCLRSAAGVPTRIRSAGNPGSVGHQWVKGHFVDITRPGNLYKDPDTGLTRCFIPSRLEDNPILDKNDPTYRKRLEQLPTHLRKAHLLGDWDIVVGQVFEEWRRDQHVVKPYQIDGRFFRFCAMDWGYSAPFSIGWYAVDNEGRYIKYREWYGWNGKPNHGLMMGASEVARKTWEISAGEGVDIMVADPAIWAKQNSDDPSIAQRFEAEGWRMEKANNDRIGGLQVMHDLLKTTGSDGRPMLVFFEGCRQSIRTIPALPYDKRKPEDVDTDAEDHAYDETRYAVASRIGHLATVQAPEVSATGYTGYNPLN